MELMDWIDLKYEIEHNFIVIEVEIALSGRDR